MAPMLSCSHVHTCLLCVPFSFDTASPYYRPFFSSDTLIFHPHQDTPLSELGKKQAERLGKWLYGRLPVHAPLAIFCSPFIRCVQVEEENLRKPLHDTPAMTLD